MKSTLSTLIAALVAGSTVHVWAQATSTPPDLSRVSIEDLLKIEVTSASKKEQRADEVPAAVSVITQEDIRRSGIRTLPELLLVSFRRGAYRVYSQWTARGDTKLANGTPDDKWNVLTDGMRVDWARGANEWTVDGSVRTGDGHTTWKFPRVSAVAAGRNLFDSTHAEYTSNVLVATRVPRSANVSLAWKF